MTRRDSDKASLVDFLRSIKFDHHKPVVTDSSCATHFAHFTQRPRPAAKDSNEEKKHIRSAN